MPRDGGPLVGLRVVDAAMVDGVAAMGSLMYRFRARGLWTDEKESNRLDVGAPFYRCYETSDGKAVAVGPIEPQIFAELVALAGLPPIDPDDHLDPATWPARHDAYAAIFRQKTRDE